MNQKSQTGQLGEDIACEYLVDKKYKIIERNYRQKWGELDIIAKAPDKILVFVEVKTLVQNPNIRPEENLTNSKLKKLKKADWQKLILIGMVGGSIPFLLFFKGLSMTSPVGASFIHKTLFIWVALLALPILKEKLTKVQLVAFAMLIFGNIAFLGVNFFSWEYAHTLILIATVFWAIESIIAKIILKNIDSIVVAWGRMFFGSIILLGFLLFTGNASGLFEFSASNFGWLFLASILLTGYVITWYSALKRLPVTVVSSFLVLASPITTMLNSIFVTHTFPSQQILGVGFIISALLLVWQFKPEKKYELELQKA